MGKALLSRRAPKTPTRKNAVQIMKNGTAIRVLRQNAANPRLTGPVAAKWNAPMAIPEA